jgi:hypothetical protein
MKHYILSAIFFVLFCSAIPAQQPEKFDISTFKVPKGWQKQISTNAVQIGTDGEKGVCLITLFKAIPAGDNSKANFEASWDTIVKETVKLTAKRETQPSSVENGWTIESGFAPYESDGNKGLVMLTTLSGNQKAVNVMILMNSGAYQKEIEGFFASLDLPKITAAKELTNTTTKQNTAVNAPPTAKNSGFHFTSTNFDDGWTAIEQEDFVRVTKGNIAVLIHYPNKSADAYNSVLKDGLSNAWNTLVAPRYSNAKNMEIKPIQSWESIAFMEADVTDRASGKNVHVVLFKKHLSKGNGRYLEFITNTKADFEREFGAYHNDEFGWDKLVNMQNRNKFAITAQDLVGKWSTSDYASLTYYYVNGGGNAGSTATSTADSFTFANSTTYSSDSAQADGVVGNQRFSRQVYKGSFSVSDWSISMTNRFRGQTEKFQCQFEAVKGGRVLLLTDSQNTTKTLVKSR